MKWLIMKDYSTPRIFVLISTAIFLFFFISFEVEANSPAPPSEMWLVFEYETSQPVEIEGIQIVECTASNCKQPILLQQYGVCNSSSCLSTDSALERNRWYDIFECAGSSKCHAASDLYNGNRFKLIVQFSDKVRASEVVESLPEGYYGEGREVGWKITVTDTDLNIVKDDSFRQKGSPQLFLIGILVTIITELIVAALYFKYRLKSKNLIAKLVMIFFINLVTFPFVWLFFPSLAQFQMAGTRSLGVVSLGAAIIYSVILVLFYHAPSRMRRWILIGISILLIPMLFVFAIVVMFIFGYRNFSPSPIGIPTILVLPLAELCAFVVEAVLITVLSKNSVPLKRAFEVSLAMNLASLVVGLGILRLSGII